MPNFQYPNCIDPNFFPEKLRYNYIKPVVIYECELGNITREFLSGKLSGGHMECTKMENREPRETR